MFSLAANKSVPDAHEYVWYEYVGKRATKAIAENQRHVLTFSPGALVGLRMSTRGTSAGNYQVVVSPNMHILFRNVDYHIINRLIRSDKLLPSEHDGSLQNQARNQHVRKVTRSSPNKLKDARFTPRNVKEVDTYDKGNYQWRKLTDATPIHVSTRRAGSTKAILRKGDIFGLRFKTNTIGGYVVLESKARINVSTALFDELVQSSSILPESKQAEGEVPLKEGNAALPKQVRKVKPRVEIDIMSAIPKYVDPDDTWGDEDAEIDDSSYSITPEKDTTVTDEDVSKVDEEAALDEANSDKFEDDTDIEDVDSDDDVDSDEDDDSDDDEDDEDESFSEDDDYLGDLSGEELPEYDLPKVKPPKELLPESVLLRGKTVYTMKDGKTKENVILRTAVSESTVEVITYNVDDRDIIRYNVPKSLNMAKQPLFKIGGRADQDLVKEAFSVYKDSVNKNYPIQTQSVNWTTG